MGWAVSLIKRVGNPRLHASQLLATSQDVDKQNTHGLEETRCGFLCSHSRQTYIARSTFPTVLIGGFDSLDITTYLGWICVFCLYQDRLYLGLQLQDAVASDSKTEKLGVMCLVAQFVPQES